MDGFTEEIQSRTIFRAVAQGACDLGRDRGDRIGAPGLLAPEARAGGLPSRFAV